MSASLKQFTAGAVGEGRVPGRFGDGWNGEQSEKFRLEPRHSATVCMFTNCLGSRNQGFWGPSHDVN